MSNMHDDIKPVFLIRRIAARLIDEIIISPIAIAAAEYGYYIGSAQHDMVLIPREFIALVSMICAYLPVSAAYYTLLQITPRATIGKRLMGLRLTGMDYGPIDFLVAFDRWLASLASAALFGYGYLRALWHPEQRTLHDIWAGTKVVYIPRHESRRPENPDFGGRSSVDTDSKAS